MEPRHLYTNMLYSVIVQSFNTAMVYKAFKTKLKLNNEQKSVMAQHAGYARWVYNWALAL